MSDGPVLVKIKGVFTVAVFKVETNYLRPQHDHWGLIVQRLNTTSQDEGRRRNDTHTHIPCLGVGVPAEIRER